MNKLLLCLLITLFIVPTSLALIACSDTNEIDITDIPCTGVTDPINCSGNVTVFNINTTLRVNETTYDTGDSLYNFTFNYTEGSYQLIDCANNSATVIVGDFPRDDLWRAAIMIGFLGIAGILGIIGKFSFDKKRWIIKTALYIFSALMILIAIDTGLIFSRVDNIDTMMVTSLTIMIVTIMIFFMYILVYYMIGLMRALRDTRDKKKSVI